MMNMMKMMMMEVMGVVVVVVKADVKPMTNELNSVKLEPKSLTNGLGNNDGLLQPKKEVEEADGKPGGNTDLDIFSTAGLKPSLADLDNMFEDIDNVMGCVLTSQPASRPPSPPTRIPLTPRW